MGPQGDVVVYHAPRICHIPAPQVCKGMEGKEGKLVQHHRIPGGDNYVHRGELYYFRVTQLCRVKSY